MSDITLSLGGKWAQANADREKQAQLIAHLTNQLEGLRAAYTEDLEKVARNKEQLIHLQEEVDRVEAEREEWKAAYNSVVNKRIERDHLVEDMLAQLQTLEVTTRNEELRSSDAVKKATLLEKEKEIVTDKFNKTKKELDEVYGRLAATSDELNTERDSTVTLSASLQSVTRSRDTKENQVVSLLKEKARLFRLVTDLRSTIKVAGGSIKDTPAKVGAASLNDVEYAVASDVALMRTAGATASSRKKKASLLSNGHVNGVNNMIDSTLNGTIDRPKWSSAAPSLRVKMSTTKKDITSTAELDGMTRAGSLNNMLLNSSASLRQSQGRSPHSRSHGGDLFGDADGDADVTDECAPPGLRVDDLDSAESRRESVAKKNLIHRLKHQIELLEEKNTELEKTIGLVKSENQLLLVRFRGAHDRRVQAEKKLNLVEKELQQCRNNQHNNNNQPHTQPSSHTQSHMPHTTHTQHAPYEEYGEETNIGFTPQQHGIFYENQHPVAAAAQRKRPASAGPNRWK